MAEALGAAFYANGQFAESAQQMCRAADLLPSIAEPYLFLGRIQQAASDIFPCSEQKLQRFANEQSRSARANFYYGLVLMKKAKQSQRDEDFQRAEEFFKKALAIEPSFGEVYLQLGMLYNAGGKKEAALQEFEKAVRATPRLTAAQGLSLWSVIRGQGAGPGTAYSETYFPRFYMNWATAQVTTSQQD